MRPKKKIDDSLLLQMADEGKSQTEIAQHFGCSPAAVCKRLKRLIRPSALKKLTHKEQRFVMEICQGENQTQAAMKAFDVGSLDSAKTLGSRYMRDRDIQEAISAVLENEGLDRRYLARKLKTHVDGKDPAVSLRAVDMGFKLHDAYPANKNLNINTEIESIVDLEAIADLFNGPVDN
jgi:hypothetical protein